MTVHKSQGSTLSCAELMLDRTFDFGQVYVALSRVKSISGLWMSRPLLARSIRANPVVVRFYEDLALQVQKQ
jgi:ATP-dependent DNA helicase PIF1